MKLFKILIAVLLVTSCGKNRNVMTSGSTRATNPAPAAKPEPQGDASAQNAPQASGDSKKSSQPSSDTSGSSSSPSNTPESSASPSPSSSSSPSPSASPTMSPSPSASSSPSPSPSLTPSPTPNETKVEIATSGDPSVSSDDLIACASAMGVSQNSVLSFHESGIFSLNSNFVYAIRVSGNTELKVLSGSGEVAGICLFMGGNAKFVFNGTFSLGALYVDGRGSAGSTLDLMSVGLKKGQAVLGGNSSMRAIATTYICSLINVNSTGSSTFDCGP